MQDSNIANIELMENTPMPKAILRLAIPTVFSTVISIVYNLTDTYFIGLLDDPVQLGAISLAFPVFTFLQAIGNMFGLGAPSYISRCLGARKYEEVRKTSAVSVYVTVILTFILTLLVSFFMEPILRLIGTSSDTVGPTRDYLRPIAGFSIVLILQIILPALLRAEGKAKEAMIGMVIGTVLNIVLDPVFILLLDMGVAGAAWATIIGNFCAVVFYIIVYLRGNTTLSIRPADFKPSMRIFKEVLKIGLPSTIAQTISSVAVILFNNVAAGYGDQVITAYGVAVKMITMEFMIVFGYVQGYVPLAGYNYGSGDPAHFGDYSGYTNPDESEHDLFTVGHTAISVSLATGLAKARDLNGGKENIVAIIGDGSMSGGEAFEGLNNAAMLNSNMIILFNDNEMSIAENFGGMYQNFAELRRTKGKAECNFFKSFGFDYYYVEEGNDTRQLVPVFQKVKDTTRPTVIHIHTLKGKGVEWAEKDKEGGHYAFPAGFDMAAFAGAESYDSITSEFLLKKMEKDPSVIAISPATALQTGLPMDFRKKAGRQYIDVGIAEEHAVAFASGLAKNGAKPVLLAISSFMQRTYDQLMQDLALNSSPATILVFLGNLSPGDATHCGIFDISMMSNIPGLVCLAPATKEEYLAMLDWSIEQTSVPVVIRVPSAVVSCENTEGLTEADFYRYQTVEKGSRVALMGLGNFFGLAGQVKELLKEKAGIEATVINPRIYSALDREMLESLKTDHSVVVTLEDGSVSGGFGEKIARFYGNSDMRVLNFGGEKMFTDRMPMEEQYAKFHLTPELIVEDIQRCMGG